tara:strand:- start:3970 stop:4428 length:459 start_codon:yes stop_codon:yes gene_type:complete
MGNSFSFVDQENKQNNQRNQVCGNIFNSPNSMGYVRVQRIITPPPPIIMRMFDLEKQTNNTRKPLNISKPVPVLKPAPTAELQERIIRLNPNELSDSIPMEIDIKPTEIPMSEINNTQVPEKMLNNESISQLGGSIAKPKIKINFTPMLGGQ